MSLDPRSVGGRFVFAAPLLPSETPKASVRKLSAATQVLGLRAAGANLVEPGVGFEPTATSLQMRCSGQLSYPGLVLVACLSDFLPARLWTSRWLERKDSNPHRRDQNPLSCR